MLSRYYEFTESQYQKFEEFYNLHVNVPINLTRIKEKQDFFFKHILDSVYFTRFLNVEFEIGIDVGTGGGFPGIVLALIYPDKMFYLIDSIRKKCEHVAHFIDELKISNAKVINDRVENIKNLKADIIFSRGVGKVTDILKWTNNVSHETTAYLFYKGEDIETEINQAKNIISKRGLSYGNLRIQEPIQRSYLYFNSCSFLRVCPKTDI
ncbi:16S rRNA (guanine(527)-N(7))-methyltransferase RsmG [Deferribacteraceae bacterium V6Fe1]|nr:16S rRNA (guanine(527)-N(7))-methyltransferase RsmG [Deferribacteraceae bacterium V6Fe1]